MSNSSNQEFSSSIQPDAAFPTHAEICRFFSQAGIDEALAEDEYEVRQIGTDPDMVQKILHRISIGEKTMTYSLPWVAARTGRKTPQPGLWVVVLDASVKPCMLLRLNAVETLEFGQVGEADIAQEGMPMRDLDAWKPLHNDVWNIKLAAYGLRVVEDMPVWGEYFDLVYQTPQVQQAWANT